MLNISWTRQFGEFTTVATTANAFRSFLTFTAGSSSAPASEAGDRQRTHSLNVKATKTPHLVVLAVLDFNNDFFATLQPADVTPPVLALARKISRELPIPHHHPHSNIFEGRTSDVWKSI